MSKGILFKPWKIKAIRDNPTMEWQTRRLDGLKEINLNPDGWEASMWEGEYTHTVSGDAFQFVMKPLLAVKRNLIAVKPRYSVGEVVYIKEALGREPMPHILTGQPTNCEHAYYRLDHAPVVERLGFDLVPWWKGKTLSPLFLPADAARYFIKILSVTPQRLWEIDGEDAMAEGVELPYRVHGDGDGEYYEAIGEHYISLYQKLWDSINPEHPWANNDWVWKYVFSTIEDTK